VVGKRRSAMAFVAGSAAFSAALAIGVAPAARPLETLALGRVVVERVGKGTVTSEGSTAIQCGTKCEARLPIGTNLALVAPSVGGIYLQSWAGECAGIALRCEVVVGAQTEVKATFGTGNPSASGNLQRVTVGGSGTVRSDEPGVIDCPARRCSALLTRGKLTLRATPLSGWIFLGWSGRCGGTDACTVDVSNPAEIQATFRRAVVPDGKSTLTVVDPGNLGLPIRYGPDHYVCPSKCKADFANRSIVTMKADSGSPPLVFSGWGPGACQGSSTTCVLAISGGATVEGHWSSPAGTKPALNVTRSGKGLVTSTPSGITCGSGRDCSAAFFSDQPVTLKAEPAKNYEVRRWGGDGATCAGLKCVVKARNGGAPVSVVFAPAQDPLTVRKSGDGAGTVTSTPAGIGCGTVCSHDFILGTRVTLMAEPDSTSRFAGWSVPCGAQSSCVFVFDKATTVTAAFARLRDKVTVKKDGDGNGTVTSQPGGISCGGTCSASFVRGSTIELRARPAAGSRFAGWNGCGSGTGACSFAVKGAKSVRARFELIRDELTVAKTGTGTGSVTSSPSGIRCGETCAARFKRGAEVVLKATANGGSRLAGWRGACGTARECRLTMQGDSRVEARFDKICTATSATGFAAKAVKGPRRVLATVTLEWTASARLSLFRGSRKLAAKTVAGLGKGTRTLRLDVPRMVKSGRARFELRLSDSCGRTRTFSKAVTVPKK
jgi:hypothetical protein